MSHSFFSPSKTAPQDAPECQSCGTLQTCNSNVSSLGNFSGQHGLRKDSELLKGAFGWLSLDNRVEPDQQQHSEIEI